MTAQEIKAECERIWNRPGVAYIHNRAGWRFAWDDLLKCGFVLQEGESNRLAPRKGAPLNWVYRLRHPGKHYVNQLLKKV
jgi:hypothetical protein